MGCESGPDCRLLSGRVSPQWPVSRLGCCRSDEGCFLRCLCNLSVYQLLWYLKKTLIYLKEWQRARESERDRPCIIPSVASAVGRSRQLELRAEVQFHPGPQCPLMCWPQCEPLLRYCQCLVSAHFSHCCIFSDFFLCQCLISLHVDIFHFNNIFNESIFVLLSFDSKIFYWLINFDILFIISFFKNFNSLLFP